MNASQATDSAFLRAFLIEVEKVTALADSTLPMTVKETLKRFLLLITVIISGQDLDRSSFAVRYLVFDLIDNVPCKVLRLGPREDSRHSPDWIEVASTMIGIVSCLIVPLLGLRVVSYSQVHALFFVYSVLFDLLNECGNAGD